MKKYLMGLLASAMVITTVATTTAITPVHGETNPTPAATPTVPKPELYRGINASGQKINTGEKIVVQATNEPITFYASAMGSWVLSGTQQSAKNTQSFTATIPTDYAGYILTLTYTPNDAGESNKYVVQIEVPPNPSPQPKPNPNPGLPINDQSKAKIDIVARGNSDSSYQIEQSDLESSNDLITVFQAPIYDIWLTTSANHFRYGNRYDAEEGSGVWAVNKVIVDKSYLNWDQTALQLSRFGAGYYDVQYISNVDSKVVWSRRVRLSNSALSLNDYCTSGETGAAMPVNSMKLVMKDGTQIGHNSIKKIENRSDLNQFTEVTLLADHAVKTGLKKIKKDGWKYWLPTTAWKYEQVGFGEDHYYEDARIGSRNVVEIFFNSTEKLATFSTDRENEGVSAIDLKEIIKKNKYKPGKYSIRITNYMYRDVCSETDFDNIYSRTEKTGKFYAMIEIPE
ncbi:hypothetical protein [Brevibacillus sp. SYSU BS000544]|uniref:hypothetical protein n=1 Tax=Brevibacillus sp. SYSU BS000544 TaxID=3416443 RepID=UPI003CE5C78C